MYIRRESADVGRVRPAGERSYRENGERDIVF